MTKIRKSKPTDLIIERTGETVNFMEFVNDVLNFEELERTIHANKNRKIQKLMIE